jgi:hypothetical protein
MHMTNNRVMEEVQIGDYEMYLVWNGNFGFPQLGLQRRGMDMTDVEQQVRHAIPRGWGNFDRRTFKATVQRWLDEHHILVVFSYSPAKTRLYGLALRALGFRLHQTGAHGMFYLADEQADRRAIEQLEGIGREVGRHRPEDLAEAQQRFNQQLDQGGGEEEEGNAGEEY